jgi:hypothetical protein
VTSTIDAFSDVTLAHASHSCDNDSADIAP